MKYRIILISMILCIIASAGFLISDTIKATNTKPDLVELNRIKVNIDSAEELNLFQFNSKYNFVVIDFSDGSILFSTNNDSDMPYDERINMAIANYDTILDYEFNGNIKGKIIVYTGKTLAGNRNNRIIFIVIPFLILSLLIALYYLYLRVYLYHPFKRLKRFAAEIAAGNLDVSLPMNKDNLFGEFSESFDLMREELKLARQKAIDEERSKKELIAALSHDIKTPISIVRAASDLLEINETDHKKIINIKAIQTKTTEIDALITDLFNSALQDLSQLKINIRDIESKEIKRIIIEADPLNKISFINEVPECLIKADALRLSQIFGNIISNSYKYAKTTIEVSYYLVDDYMKISFKDFGKSLKIGELPMLTNKFYRGENAYGLQGAGLGLYMCSEILKMMDGSLNLQLEDDGFIVDIGLNLS